MISLSLSLSQILCPLYVNGSICRTWWVHWHRWTVCKYYNTSAPVTAVPLCSGWRLLVVVEVGLGPGHCRLQKKARVRWMGEMVPPVLSDWWDKQGGGSGPGDLMFWPGDVCWRSNTSHKLLAGNIKVGQLWELRALCYDQPVNNTALILTFRATNCTHIP